MPITIRSYYETTPVTDEQLNQYIRVSRNQEEKVYNLFKRFGCMTSWDVYDVYNQLVGPILKSSVGRSINTLETLGVIQQIGSIPGDTNRPVFLYKLINGNLDRISKNMSIPVPKTIRLDVVFNNEGKIDIDKMIKQLDIKLNLLSETFNI